MAQAVHQVHVAGAVKEYLVDLADASRRHPDVAIGMSPRATLAVLRAGRVRAAAAGREFVVPDDVQELLAPTVAHRLTLTADARLEGAVEADVLADVLGSIPVPTRRSSSA
jgi:MoxR-like ATPase